MASHRGEPEAFDEVLQVACVGAVGCPGEAVVPTRENLDASLVHLDHRFGGDLQLALVAGGFCGLLRIAEVAGLVEGGEQPVHCP